MPTLKREWFMRPTRMVHRFGERDDPLQMGSEQTFEVKRPNAPKSQRGAESEKLSIQSHGLHVYTQPFSPVSKFKGGNASLSGPKLDRPDAEADPVPASTNMRRTQGPFIKSKKQEEK